MTSCLRLIEEFCDLMSERVAEKLRPYLADDAVYQNAGMPATVGVEDILANLAGQFAAYPDSYHYVMKNIAAAEDIDIVMTERLDMIRTPSGVQGVPVMGTFRVIDGKISRWTDYWDTALPRKMMQGEDVAALVPATY